jgi:hypothetical protein
MGHMSRRNATIGVAQQHLRSMARQGVSSTRSKAVSFISKASNFMLAFLIVWMWNCINGLYNIYSSGDPVYALMLMQAVGVFCAFQKY